LPHACLDESTFSFTFQINIYVCILFHLHVHVLQHAALCVDAAGRLWLADLGSGKGTFVLPVTGAPVRVPAGDARELAVGGSFFLEDPSAAQIVFRIEVAHAPPQGDGGPGGGAGCGSPTRVRGEGRYVDSAGRAGDLEEGEEEEEEEEEKGEDGCTAAGERKRPKKEKKSKKHKHEKKSSKAHSKKHKSSSRHSASEGSSEDSEGSRRRSDGRGRSDSSSACRGGGADRKRAQPKLVASWPPGQKPGPAQLQPLRLYVTQQGNVLTPQDLP
jgi:hypothetical protein